MSKRKIDKRKTPFTIEDDGKVSQWENSPFYRLAIIELHREGHPWIYLGKSPGSTKYEIDVDHDDYNQDKLHSEILDKMLILVRLWEKNYARNEVKV